jgi:hypothetical protein
MATRVDHVVLVCDRQTPRCRDVHRAGGGRIEARGPEIEKGVHEAALPTDASDEGAREDSMEKPIASCARTGRTGSATSNTLAKAATLFNTPSPNTRLSKPASVYPGERIRLRAPCLSGFFSMRPNALQPGGRIVRSGFVSTFAKCWLYFPPDFSGAGYMEIQQLKSEITALRARFDALRGYL